MRAAASVTEDTATHPKSGEEEKCLFAECNESGTVIGPIWGTSDKSRKRALASLTEECECPANYHYDEDADAA